MRCVALTTPLRLHVGLDHKDADEQTFTEYWLTRFRPLCSSSTPAESSVICGVELQTCAITGEPCAGELCAGEPCWRGRNLRGRNRGSAQRSASVRPAFGQRGAVCCCIECGCSHKPDSCGVRKARGAAATVRASCLCACVRARVVCAALRAAQRSQSCIQKFHLNPSPFLRPPRTSAAAFTSFRPRSYLQKNHVGVQSVLQAVLSSRIRSFSRCLCLNV